MSARAPAAIYALWDRIHALQPSVALSGIVGDVAHSFGYHLARHDLPSGDYSVVLSKDRDGASDCASALDIKPANTAGMIQLTSRLLAAAKAGDPRLAALREFCGTTDGTRTHPYDLSNGQDGPLDSWDSSHLWHIHLSFYREYADNAAALAPIADVLAGKPLEAPDMQLSDTVINPNTGKPVTLAVIFQAMCRTEAFAQLSAELDQAGAVADKAAAAETSEIEAKVGAA